VNLSRKREKHRRVKDEKSESKKAMLVQYLYLGHYNSRFGRKCRIKKSSARRDYTVYGTREVKSPIRVVSLITGTQKYSD